MKFCTIRDEYDWGAEIFKLADLGYRDSLVREGWLAGNAISEIMDMYVDRVVGEKVFEFWGRQFPVCVRQLEVRGKMALRVNPDDETAAQRWDFLGKEKIWYVLRCGKGAGISLGFIKDTDAGEVFAKCADGTVGDIINHVAPHQGQFFHIPSGTPHAAEGDIDILEIGESSPLDFCMCNWGKEVSELEFDPSLSFEDSLDFIRYSRYKDDLPLEKEENLTRKIISISQFRICRIRLESPLQIRNGDSGSFILYSCVSGEASVQTEIDGKESLYNIKAGETMLVPDDCQEFFLLPIAKDTVLLETTIAERTVDDPYINPEAEPALPEDNTIPGTGFSL